MTVYICLLRAVNVANNRMKMDDLRVLLDSLGLSDAQTLLQSGNVVFRSDESNTTKLAAKIEAGIQQKFGFASRVILRTAQEFSLMMSKHPYTKDQQTNEGKMLVMFFDNAPSSDAIAALKNAYSGPETIHITGREAFIFYVDGIGRSKLTTALIEKHLKVAGTGRNWKTITKLNDLATDF